MNARLTAGLAVVAAFLGLLLHFWGREDEGVRRRLDQARRAFRFDAARVDRVVVETGDLAIECRREGDGWQIVRPIAARADPVAIERLLGALQELPRGEVILPPRRVADAYAPYGLDDPRTRIELVEGAATNRIHVGRRTPLGDGLYVRRPDRHGVVRIRSDLLDLLPSGVDALRDRSLLVGAPASIQRLDVRGPSGYIQLARDADGSWRFFQPFTARADSATVVALVEQLLACKAVQFVQDSVRDLAPYGLDGQSAVTALLNLPSGQGSQLLALGDPLPNAPHLVYARLQADHSVYAVPLAVRQALLVRPDDLRDRRIPGILPDAIRRIRAEEGERVLELVRENGSWRIESPLSAPANAEAVGQLLRGWADVRLAAFEAAPPSNAPPLARRLRLELRDARPDAVDLRIGAHPNDSAAARIAIDGDSAVAVATPPHLLAFPLDPLPYRSLDVLDIAPDDALAVHVASGSRNLRAERNAATGAWPAENGWIAPLLAALSPLRADSLLALSPAPADAFAKPHLALTVRLKGQAGISATLLVGDEIESGGARRATLRGRDLVFALSPKTVAALLPPASETAE